jgi:hypothetical protein
MSDPKILNLDELELTESDITIVHNKTEHRMATLSVEGFLKQQLRDKQQKTLEKRIADAGDVDENDTASMIQILRDGVQDFFPTLPVGELEVAKLLRIFGWLNELAMQITEAEAPAEVVEAAAGDENQGESAEGNGE